MDGMDDSDRRILPHHVVAFKCEDAYHDLSGTMTIIITPTVQYRGPEPCLALPS